MEPSSSSFRGSISCTPSLLLKCSSHSSEWICSCSSTTAHKTSEARVIHSSHLLSHEHFEDFIWVDLHSSCSAARTSGHTTEVELHSSWHSTESTSSHSILHIIHTKAHVMLFTLFRITQNNHCLIYLFELLFSFGFGLLISLTVSIWMPISGEFSIGFLNVIFTCVFCDSKNPVVIFFPSFLCVLLCVFQFLLHTET